MATKIELEYPYNRDWKYGYVVVNSDNRKTLILYNSHKHRSSTQYARYLLAVSLGRYLNSDETVDRIDGDKHNNSLDNLQILSIEDNTSKSRKKPDVQLVCPVCNTEFSRTRTQLRGRRHLIESGTIACSRVCGGKKRFTN